METDKHMEDSEKGLFGGEFIDTWHSNYRKLEALGKRKGAFTWDMEEELARWVSIQRRIRHMLPVALKNKLAALDIDFEAMDNSWEAMCSQLARFVEKSGHACPPDDPKHEGLRDWLNRQLLSKSLLSESQFQRLDSLGVEWDRALSRDHRWEVMLSRLEGFREAFGHCRVPQRWAKDKQLALWVTVQRRVHAQSKMREDRKRRLTELNFVWSIQDVFESQWEEYFQQMASFYERHGHCRMPGKYEKLVSWMERQRLSRKKGLLAEERERRLDGIGFTWSFDKTKRENWEERYRQLRAYRQTHGHSFVPVNCRENKSLGIWVASQRLLEARGRLGADRRRKLDKLGFVWSRDTQRQLQLAYDAQWEASFRELEAYRRKHGTCQVSLKTDPALQRWTRRQRDAFLQGNLPQERVDRLNEIRFPWSVQEGYWMRMYDALVDFREGFGHTRVPSGWDPNPRLAAWAYRTRRDRKKLTAQKVELLNQIGFDWSLSRKTAVPWGEMYGRLVKYQQEHGHTRVPVKWRQDPRLGKWAGRMRHERERLAPGRFALLEAIGFDWVRRPASGKTAKCHTRRICSVVSSTARSIIEQE